MPMKEHEEKKRRLEARKDVETVGSAFLIGQRRRYQVARMKICNRGVDRKRISNLSEKRGEMSLWT